MLLATSVFTGRGPRITGHDSPQHNAYESPPERPGDSSTRGTVRKGHDDMPLQRRHANHPSPRHFRCGPESYQKEPPGNCRGRTDLPRPQKTTPPGNRWRAVPPSSIRPAARPARHPSLCPASRRNDSAAKQPHGGARPDRGLRQRPPERTASRPGPSTARLPDADATSHQTRFALVRIRRAPERLSRPGLAPSLEDPAERRSERKRLLDLPAPKILPANPPALLRCESETSASRRGQNSR